MDMETDPGVTPGPVTVETIRIYADLSIRRACGFALLAISCVMLSFSFDLVLAFRIGAVLIAILSAILYLKSLNALRRPYARTELWIMLPERPKAGKEELQRLIGSVLAERFWWHTKAAAGVSGTLALLAALVWLARL